MRLPLKTSPQLYKTPSNYNPEEQNNPSSRHPPVDYPCPPTRLTRHGPIGSFLLTSADRLSHSRVSLQRVPKESRKASGTDREASHGDKGVRLAISLRETGRGPPRSPASLYRSSPIFFIIK